MRRAGAGRCVAVEAWHRGTRTPAARGSHAWTRTRGRPRPAARTDCCRRPVPVDRPDTPVCALGTARRQRPAWTSGHDARPPGRGRGQDSPPGTDTTVRSRVTEQASQRPLAVIRVTGPDRVGRGALIEPAVRRLRPVPDRP